MLWELTDRCPLRCDFCHTRASSSHDELTWEEATRMLDRLQSMGVTNIIFSGGEPLLYPRLQELLEEAAVRGFSIDLCTSLMSIPRGQAERLAEVLSEVSVSFDSADASVHDAVRGVNGAHRQAIQGVEAFHRAGVETHAISMVDSRTFAGMGATAEFLESLGVHSVTLLGRMRTDDTPCEPTLLFGEDVVRDALDQIRSQRQIPVHSKRLIFKPEGFECQAGQTLLGIDAAGNLLPCILLKGGVAESSTGWRRTFSKSRRQRCAGCALVDRCAGGCPGATALAGAGIGVDTLCQRQQPGE